MAEFKRRLRVLVLSRRTPGQQLRVLRTLVVVTCLLAAYLGYGWYSTAKHADLERQSNQTDQLSLIKNNNACTYLTPAAAVERLGVRSYVSSYNRIVDANTEGKESYRSQICRYVYMKNGTEPRNYIEVEVREYANADSAERGLQQIKDSKQLSLAGERYAKRLRALNGFMVGGNELYLRSGVENMIIRNGYNGYRDGRFFEDDTKVVPTIELAEQVVRGKQTILDYQEFLEEQEEG